MAPRDEASRRWRGLSLSSSEELGYTVDESIAVPHRKLERCVFSLSQELAVWKKIRDKSVVVPQRDEDL